LSAHKFTNLQKKTYFCIQIFDTPGFGGMTFGVSGVVLFCLHEFTKKPVFLHTDMRYPRFWWDDFWWLLWLLVGVAVCAPFLFFCEKLLSSSFTLLDCIHYPIYLVFCSLMEESFLMEQAEQSIDQIWEDVEQKKEKEFKHYDGDSDSDSNSNDFNEDGNTNSKEEGIESAMSSAATAAMTTTTDESDAKLPDLDCYPYTFSPLLLFAPGDYFDKGFSNYNSVAQFFSSKLTHVDMLENVLYDRKNMLYEELLEFVTTRRMLIICCIDAHFTAFQILSDKTLIYYDPMHSSLSLITSDSGFQKFVLFMLLKCHYGNSQHIQDNENEYYTGRNASSIRRMVYLLWRDINKTEGLPYGIRKQRVSLNLDRYLLINSSSNPEQMSTQETGNTCYFQVYLFGVLCKVGLPALDKRNSRVELLDVPALDQTTVDISSFLLEFFVDGAAMVMRPLTNSNIVLDFFRYRQSVYFQKFAKYLQFRTISVPNYDLQYDALMDYFVSTKVLHTYSKFTLSGSMSSTLNSKSLQFVVGCDDAVNKLAMSHYYKYRAANLMFGFNSGILHKLRGFASFNALRKNQLLAFYDELSPIIKGYSGGAEGSGVSMTMNMKENKFRDYYFMPQFEVGQQELVDIHHYTYLIDLFAMSNDDDPSLASRIQAVNQCLVENIFFSTQRLSDYDKFMSKKEFVRSKKFYDFFLNTFMSIQYLESFVGLGFSDTNPKEKDINSLTQTVFYSTEMMTRQQHRMEYEFEKECINQMARSSLRKYDRVFGGGQDMAQKYRIFLKIGLGFTYSKYNTLMHLLNVVEKYWQNPDLNSIHVLGKDIRALLAIACQKIFFEKGHSFYHYGPLEMPQTNSYSSGYGGYSSVQQQQTVDMDLAVSNSLGDVLPGVSREKRGNTNQLTITDRVFEFNYLKDILSGMFDRADGKKLKTDNVVLNLILLSLMLDFGLFVQYSTLLHLPFLQALQHGGNTKELQVEISNWIHEFDKKNVSDSVTRLKVEELLFEMSYKFMVNKNFNVKSKEYAIIRELSADPIYHQYVLLCKIYMSLCQINKSAEVDYYKVKCNGEFRIIIPQNFSNSTSDYLDEISKRHTFSEHNGFIEYAEMKLFDVRTAQPEINLYKVRIDSSSTVQSMVKYVEISNVFGTVDDVSKFLVFIADNALRFDASNNEGVVVTINQIVIEVSTIFFNPAISFVPCFKYADSEDVLLFTSKNVHYLVDNGGQFNPDYYGMKHELIECIASEEVFVDLNDDHVFKSFKLSELLTESKTVFYFPDYLLQVQSRQQLINLLDLAIYIRNLSLFILVLLQLRRCSVALTFIEKENKIQKITGPWKEAILYVLGRGQDTDHYDSIHSPQFFDLNQHQDLPLSNFVDILCENFTKFQRFVDGAYQIVPTVKQKEFLQKIIKSEECFHFSEVGSGKTKVILPLLCQTFLSNNTEAHQCFARGGKAKHVLVILVPEHLVSDAKAQIFRYCLCLNFRDEYRVYDDIFALLHDDVQLRRQPRAQRTGTAVRPLMKQIFITSFNQFKKALTYDAICTKVWPARENILCIVDEVDDFLDRDKLVFNICSNKGNAFEKATLDRYFDVSRAVFRQEACPVESLATSPNPEYWTALYDKCRVINVEIMDASRSINKSFGIFNEQTLRHCSLNIAQDVEGYKSLIARPYESVNRAMPGSYYSDVERTVYLTYYILMEDIAKYNELFQQERKFISFEYYSEYILHELDYDDLVYGDERLSELVEKHPPVKDGLSRFLFEIILRRMEIRDKSRSVNSIDIVFNFDCVGFTGTPFIDNYPTFAYIRSGRSDKIPDMIDRSFYVHRSDDLSTEEYEERFTRFQGKNSNVMVEYVSSDFIANAPNEMHILQRIFNREETVGAAAAGGASAAAGDAGAGAGTVAPLFNVLVDLCGIFKRSSVHEVRNLVLQHYGPDQFHYIYHIDQVDSSDRVMSISSDNDVAMDEEFYKFLCQTYGDKLREKVFFFVDNRNVIGKDVPFQLIYQRHFQQPMFTKSIVLAHDVSDFSKIWQGMGRSRTMNDTVFTIYKNGIGNEYEGIRDIKTFSLTRQLYVTNCDCKMAGNLSSIYQTLVSLCNFSNEKFYYCDEIVNAFLEKMNMTLTEKVRKHEKKITTHVFGSDMSTRILCNIFADKFSVSSNVNVVNEPLTKDLALSLIHHIVQQKFEQRLPSLDIFDELICFLSGEQNGVTEISYTKQQQKQKQKQQNKNQDSDTMETFDKKKQLNLVFETDNYFDYTLNVAADLTKISLNLPIAVPIFQLSYTLGGKVNFISVYPTLMFLYSHHIHPDYITPDVRSLVSSGVDNSSVCAQFLEAVCTPVAGQDAASEGSDLDFEIVLNNIRQSPHYSLAGVRKGVYVIGMKDQFNIHDMQQHPLRDDIEYIADEMGFILFDKQQQPRSVDTFGPYFIEQYLLMEALSKQEVAQNVLDYYIRRKSALQSGVQSYSEQQGGGFVCWRFLMSDAAKDRGRGDVCGSTSLRVGDDLDEMDA
jgi:hypothetical protein